MKRHPNINAIVVTSATSQSEQRFGHIRLWNAQNFK